MLRGCARSSPRAAARSSTRLPAANEVIVQRRSLSTANNGSSGISSGRRQPTTYHGFGLKSVERSARLQSGSFASLSLRSFHASPLRLESETVKVPQMAESISEGTLKTWVKKKGDFVKQDEEVATIETDKIDVSVNAPKSGTITETFAEEEDTVAVGNDLFKMELGDAPAEGSSGGEEKPKDEGKEEEKKDEGKEEKKKEEEAEPREEKTARREKPSAKLENKEEVPDRPEPKKSESIKQPKAEQSARDREAEQKPAGSGKEGKVVGEGDRTERRVKMNRMRQRIAERLKQSQNTAASLTTFNEIDMSSLMDMRSTYKDQILKEQGIKFGFMSAFARASVLALQEMPIANASIEGPGSGEQIVYRDYVDLSVAVATPKGLVTPVIRNAEGLNMIEVEKAIAELGKKARDNKLTIEDMAGGTFTISNGGVFGSLFGTPIINLPQTAVLGMHTIKQRPVVVDGQIVIRPIMVVALTYDHRLLDGSDAVTFLVKIKNYIEDPRRMLLTAF